MTALKVAAAAVALTAAAVLGAIAYAAMAGWAFEPATASPTK